jgi:rRNA maturation RNase YbeY
MKMFLTRLGFGSKAVVTGDITQIDLPPGRVSGLVEALKVVGHVPGIATVYFDDRDVVRHALVQRIVKAYESYSSERRRSAPARLRVLVTDDRGRPERAPGLARWLAAHAPARARGTMTIALVPDATMRRLNRTFRGQNYATDVLSFGPLGPDPHAPRRRPQATVDLGEVAIATGVAARQAREAGHPVGTELRILALHGLLHLLGYDHEADQGEMEELEEGLRRRAGLPVGLIARASSRVRR